jgi:NAD(P)-dependent dehydrogenase (short-subunit alcohol dehydrogenase family)
MTGPAAGWACVSARGRVAREPSARERSARERSARGQKAREPSARAAGGRVALVSGGNRGLGLQIVRTLAEQGMQVVLGSRSAAPGHDAIELLGDVADRVAVRQLDITDPDSVDQLASWLRRALGRCDVLVNNAAVLLDDDSEAATAVDLDLVSRTLETNLLGTWRLAQAVAPLMRARRRGRIVNVSSGLASLATMRRGLPAYRVSKCAVNALTRILADELAEYGILVNACCPEPLRFESWDGDGAARLSASADTPVWLATLPDGGPTGGLYRERALIEW